MPELRPISIHAFQNTLSRSWNSFSSNEGYKFLLVIVPCYEHNPPFYEKLNELLEFSHYSHGPAESSLAHDVRRLRF